MSRKRFAVLYLAIFSLLALSSGCATKPKTAENTPASKNLVEEGHMDGNWRFLGFEGHESSSHNHLDSDDHLVSGSILRIHPLDDTLGYYRVDENSANVFPRNAWIGTRLHHVDSLSPPEKTLWDSVLARCDESAKPCECNAINHCSVGILNLSTEHPAPHLIMMKHVEPYNDIPCGGRGERCIQLRLLCVGFGTDNCSVQYSAQELIDRILSRGNDLSIQHAGLGHAHNE